MSNIFFSSDHHFGHRNVIEHCNRPFHSVEEMDEVMIERWNSRVDLYDTVYYLGDFTLGNIKIFEKYYERLNGSINFLRGNHDDNWWNKFNHTHGKQLGDMFTIKVNFPDKHYSVPITMSHYSMRSWNKSHFGTWALFGHHHGKLAPYGKSFDVGVDVHDFYPWSLEEIEEKMQYLVPTGIF